MYTVGGSHAPEDERSGENDKACAEGPETLLGFYDPIVAAGEFNGEPVAEGAGKY